MRKPLLIISRDPHHTLFDGARCLLPLAEVEPHLVSNPWLVAGVDSGDFRHTTVCDFVDDDRVERTCDWIVGANGIRGIVALHEKMVLMAARLRTVHGLPGLQLDTALLFRDKVWMKRAVRAHGVTVPDFQALDDEGDLAAVDWSRGRHVIKPRRGVGSNQIYIVGSPATAREVWRRIGAPAGTYEIEEFIAGDMFHCEGIVQDGRVLHTSVGQYHARPGDAAPGAMAGSYLLPDGELARRIAGMHERVVAALGFGSGVTHLEVFHTPQDRLVFCEIAARPGGGGIDRMVLRRHGVHLREAAIRIEAGLPPMVAHPPVSAGDQTVWGRVGIYPHGRAPAELTAQECGELGVAEYEYRPAAGGDDALPRHSADYAHRFILSGSSPADFMAKAVRLRAAAERWRR
ncbi:ATP-grasp domain-containing protein [Nonomuraea sp. NPDC004297]